MTGDRLQLAVASLLLALALSGCATTRTGGSGDAEVSTGDANTQAAAIKGTRVVSASTGLSSPEDPLALRVPARVMRIWIAPWEDSRGDLHAPGYLYTEIEPRRWTLGAQAERNRETLVRPLQIERRNVPARTTRSGRDTGATRTPSRLKASDNGPNLLGS
jgi:conjugal transfer pilus assembly protein TraV